MRDKFLVYVSSCVLSIVLLRQRARTSNPSRIRPSGLSICLGLAALLAASSSQGGVISERLTEQMNRLPANGTVSALVTLSDQLDFAKLEADMARLGIKGRAARHEYVVRAAQELARETQPTLLASLQVEKLAGRVRSFQPFWVTNTIAVEAEPRVIQALSLRWDTGMIYTNDELSLREGADEDMVPAQAANQTNTVLQDNLIAIHVQHAWDLGYTGAGRLVCDFDTGADGDHPAYASRWRGLDPGVVWWEAWNDPYGHTTFPYDSRSHGTHTLGLMVAHPPGDAPLGVAYEAKWMAAGILIGYNVQRIIECYQWACDPDSDATTIADVPDVINNSWGTSGDCDQIYWNAIDLVEAAGIVNTIAVDNTGPNPGSVNSPESRAATPYQNFGVGNVDPHQPGYPINPGSGRGPSPCDGVSIKPEMTAPGTNIYSTIPDNTYGYKTGTSMACPHVSGAVAILRQVNPDLTVEQIKDLLMATSYDRGVPGEDNDYGWGVLDVGAAVDSARIAFPGSPAPHNLAVITRSELTADLTWERPSGIFPANPLVGYNVYRAADLDTFPDQPLATTDSTLTAYTDESLNPGTYRYVVTARYLNGTESDPSNEAAVFIRDPAGVPLASRTDPGMSLVSSPNPFRGRTELRLQTEGGGPIRLEIYDAAGHRVRTLNVGSGASSGSIRQTYSWDGLDDQGRPLPAGAYFARVASPSGSTGSRLVLLH